MASMHERFSRWIGPLPTPHTGVAGRLILVGVVGLLIAAFLAEPALAISVIATVIVLSLPAERRRAERVRSLSATRPAEDIGSFARAFNRRGATPVDPWAIRAVWNELVPLTKAKGRWIPLRPSDRIAEDLGIDLEDVEDVVLPLVEQCQRIPGRWTENPFYDRLVTVGDLVHFISAQPLRSAAHPELLPDER